METNLLIAHSIDQELNWLEKVIQARFTSYFELDQPKESVFTILPPNVDNDESFYGKLIKHYELSFTERLLLILTLAPSVRPEILDIFFARNKAFDRGYTEFGGITGKQHGGFIPTGETACFILGGKDIQIRIELLKLLNPQHIFYRHNIIKLEGAPDNEPQLSGVLRMSEDYIDLLTIETARKPSFSAKFPATLVETKLTWEDLVLDTHVKKQIDTILGWIEHQDTILNDWGLDGVVKPGYRALFYGPPGTGKTLTASLLGKYTGKDVYKIDVSMVTSKWVGETEKNLARVFDMAEKKDWILFFDEADALFGNRTNASSSQDRYANQEVSYLLQRTEEYPGVVILASNLKGNIDQAFTRRFQSIVYYKMPDARERLSIWNKVFHNGLTLAEDVVLTDIAKQFEISGGSIVNVLKYCATQAARSGEKMVTKEYLIEGIRNELIKEGKTV